MFHRRRLNKSKQTFFISAYGYELEYFEKNFEKYFGEDVTWERKIHVDSGTQGFEVRVDLGIKVRKEIERRMRADSQKAEVVAARGPQGLRYKRSVPEIIEQDPKSVAAAMPHLDLFPDTTFSSAYLAAYDNRSPLDKRLTRSTPTSPIFHETKWNASGRITSPCDLDLPDFSLGETECEATEPQEEEEESATWGLIEYYGASPVSDTMSSPPINIPVPSLRVQRAPNTRMARSAEEVCPLHWANGWQ